MIEGWGEVVVVDAIVYDGGVGCDIVLGGVERSWWLCECCKWRPLGKRKKSVRIVAIARIAHPLSQTCETVL